MFRANCSKVRRLVLTLNDLIIELNIFISEFEHFGSLVFLENITDQIEQGFVWFTYDSAEYFELLWVTNLIEVDLEIL